MWYYESELEFDSICFYCRQRNANTKERSIMKRTSKALISVVVAIVKT